MSGAAFAFQKSVYAALMTSPAIAGGRVYDFVPEQAVYPFVSFSDGEASDASGTNTDDKEVALIVNVWSQAEGTLEADTLAEAIYDRLHRTALQSTGWQVVFNYERDRGHFRDPDGKTRRVICRYRAYLERV